MNRELASQVFGGATALAGLILVFLGGTISAYEAFDRQARFAVRGAYRRRGALALGGFLTALASAILALMTYRWAHPYLLAAAVISLGIAFLLLAILAVMAFVEI